MSEYRLEIAIFEGGGSLWPKISLWGGRPPPTICAWLDKPVNALQLCCWKFSHKETSYQTFFEPNFNTKKRSIFFCEAPFEGYGQPTLFTLGSLESWTRSRLPISDNWTFLARCFRFVTMHTFDGQTNRQTDGFISPIPRSLHSMQRGKNTPNNYVN